MELEPFWKFDRREQPASHSSFLSRLAFRSASISARIYVHSRILLSRARSRLIPRRIRGSTNFDLIPLPFHPRCHVLVVFFGFFLGLAPSRPSAPTGPRAVSFLRELLALGIALQISHGRAGGETGALILKNP